MSKLNSIEKFYAGKTIFITGGSGFMGKVLIEKLLYSCSDLKQVVVLMRPKKSKTAQERIDDFANIPAFGRIISEKPEVMKKIFPVWGDINAKDLGLSGDHLVHVLQTTDIVFHLAASVNLIASLRPSVISNLTATKNVLDLAKQMRKLVQMVHLSTAFCCEERKVLYEKVYDFHHSPYDLMKCAEWMSEAEMAAIQPGVLGSQPNTYTYTKRLAEILVRDEYGKLPVCIVRPSFVGPAYAEPLPGWTDSLNGPTGLGLAVNKGVLRSILMKPDCVTEGIPVDACINGMICMVKLLATAKRSDEVPVYNVSLHESRKITAAQTLKYGEELIKKYPCMPGIWYPTLNITQNVFVHTLHVLLFQWIPAYFIDFWLWLFRQKTFMVTIQKRMSVGVKVFRYFAMREWKFRTEKFENLLNLMTEEEQKMFPFNTKDQGSDYEYMKNAVLGARQYFIKEPLSTLPKARLLLKLQFAVHIVCKYLFWYFVCSKLVKIVWSCLLAH